MLFRSIFFCCLAFIASAHAYQPNHPIQISNAYARATVTPEQRNGVAFLNIENTSEQTYRLTSAVASISKMTQIHTMIREGDVMKMREAGTITLAPNATVEMVPGKGYHIMLIGLTQPLQAGDTFSLALNFEKKPAGSNSFEKTATIELQIPVRKEVQSTPTNHGHTN